MVKCKYRFIGLQHFKALCRAVLKMKLLNESLVKYIDLKV